MRVLRYKSIKSGPTYRNFIVCPCGGRSDRGALCLNLAQAAEMALRAEL
jgi:hypothetical protein